jgi:tetratricopeptide (TPR) repeat protein
MQNSKLIIAVLLLIGLFVTGYQCSSTELTSARLYIQQKNYDKAIEVLNQDIAKNPKSDEGYYWLGIVYSELDSVDLMIASFDKSMKISNKFAKEIKGKNYEVWSEYMNKGLSYYNKSIEATGDSVEILLQKAIPNFKSAIAVEPDSGLGYQYLAISFLRNSEYDAAVDPLKKLIDLDSSEVGYQYLGEIYRMKGEEKMNDFKDSKNPEDSINAMQYYDDAIATLETGTSLYPRNADMMNSKFTAYIGADRIEEALSSAKTIAEENPDDQNARYNYGVVLLQLHKFPEAETELKKAIELNPENENAIYNLAITYISWGAEIQKEADAKGEINEDYKQKYQLALPYMEQVVQQDSENAQLWEVLGKVYTNLGMTDKAEDAFAKADALR